MAPKRAGGPTALDGIAHGLGPPCLAAAFVLYAFVSWAPNALPVRELVCASLLVAGSGAALITWPGATRRWRLLGAAAMSVGFAAVLAIGLR